MLYYLAYKRISKDRFYALKRSGDYDVFHVFNSRGSVCGLRLCSRFVLPLGELSPCFVQDCHPGDRLNSPDSQLSLFDEYENQ